MAALGQRNEETRAADLLRQQVADAGARSGLIEDITGRAEQYLLGLPKPENAPIDYSQAASDFYGTLGIDEAAAKSFFGDQPLTSIFNESNRNRLVLDDIRKKTPEFLDLVEASGGYGSDEAFKKAREAMGIPDYMVDPMRTRVKKELEIETSEREVANKKELLEYAKQLIKDGDEANIAPLVTGMAESMKFDVTTPKFKTYISNIQTQAQREFDEEQRQLEIRDFKTLVDIVNTEIDRGNKRGLENTLDVTAKRLGFKVTGEGWKKYKQDILAEAQRVRDNENAEITRRRNTEDAAAANTFRTTLKGDADLDALIRRGMLNEARAEIDDMVSRYADPNIKALMKDVGDQFIQSRIAFQQDVQDDILRERYDAAQVANAEVGINFKTANVQAATDHFTSFAGSGKTNPNAGPHAGNAAMAAQDLALEFQMTPSTLAIITDVFKSIEEPASRQQLTQAARQQLQGIAQPFAQAQSAAVNSAMVKSRGGSYAQDTTVANWRQTTSERIESHTTGISEGIERIRQSNRPPADKVMMLEALNQQMQQGYAYINTAIRDSITESTGENTWVTYGTPMLDAQAEYFGPNGLRPRIEQSMKTLTADIKRMSEQEAEKAAAAAKAQPQTPNNSITSDATTVAGREADIEQQTNARRNTVDQFRDNARNKIDLIGRNYSNQSDAEYQDNLALAAFLGNAHGNMNDPLTFPIISGSLTGYDDSGPAGVMNEIINDDDKFSAFKADPYGFMKSYQYNGKNWYEGWLERNQ